MRFLQEMFNDDYYQKGSLEEEAPEVSDEELQGKSTAPMPFHTCLLAL